MKTDEVSATVIQVEPGRVHVRVETTLVRRRSAAARNAFISALTGFATTSVLLMLSVFAPLAAVAGGVVALGGMALTRRNYRRVASGAQHYRWLW